MLTYKTGVKPMLSNVLVEMNQILFLKCLASSKVGSRWLKNSIFSLLTCPELLLWKMLESGVLTVSLGNILCILSCLLLPSVFSKPLWKELQIPIWRLRDSPFMTKILVELIHSIAKVGRWWM